MPQICRDSVGEEQTKNDITNHTSNSSCWVWVGANVKWPVFVEAGISVIDVTRHSYSNSLRFVQLLKRIIAIGIHRPLQQVFNLARSILLDEKTEHRISLDGGTRIWSAGKFYLVFRGDTMTAR